MLAYSFIMSRNEMYWTVGIYYLQLRTVGIYFFFLLNTFIPFFDI